MKRTSFALCFVLAFFAIISCNGNSGSGGLRIGIWDTNQEGAIVAVLKDFTAETGINVSVEVTPWDQYWTLLEAATTGGVLPDVFWGHTDTIIRYMSNGILMDLTDRIVASSVTDMSNFPRPLVELYSYNNRNYGIPKDFGLIALWYNKKLFDEAGLAYPDGIWNWDDLRNAAQKLTSNGVYGYASVPDGQNGYWQFVFQNNGWIISKDWTTSGYDDPRTIEALQFAVDMVSDGYSPSAADFAENPVEALFSSGVVAMAQIGSWMVPEMNRHDYVVANAGVAVLPSGRDGTRASNMNGLGWVANAKTKYPDETWKLLEFLSREDIQRRLSESGIAISAFNGTTEGWVRSFPHFDLSPYAEQIPYGFATPTSRNSAPWQRMSSDMLLKAWIGDITVEDACKEIAQRMNQMLALE